MRVVLQRVVGNGGDVSSFATSIEISSRLVLDEHIVDEFWWMKYDTKYCYE